MSNVIETLAGTRLKVRVAEEVRALMARRRVRQADLALVLGVKQPQVSQRLAGRIEFTLSELELLAVYFDTTPAALMGYGTVAPPPPDGSISDLRAWRDSNSQPSDPKVLPSAFAA